MSKKLSANTSGKLLLEIDELRARLSESEEALNAIRNGEVDAIIVSGKGGEKVFSLTSAETPYRILLEQMNEGAVSLTADGNILYCNQAFANLLSVPIEKIVGSNCLQYISEGERAKFKRILKKSLKGRANGDFSYTKKGGQTIHMNFSFQSLSADMDADVCIVTSDITQKKKYQYHLEELVKKRTSAIERANIKLSNYIIEIEKAKEDSSKAWVNAMTEKNRLEIIMDTLPVGVAITGTEGGVISSNRLFDQIWGGSRPETKNVHGYSKYEATWVETNKPVQPNEWASAIAVQKGETVVNQQISITRFDGTNAFILNSAAPIFKTNGGIEGCVVVIQDITVLKTIENDLKDAQDRLNVALENGKIGVWEWDIKSNGMIWDKRMGNIFGIETGILDQTYTIFENYINEEDLTHFRKAIKQTLELNLQFETVIRTKPVNGNCNFISVKALVNKDKNGKPVSLTGVCFDVTDMKMGAEKVLIKLNEELLRSNKDLEQFAYVASHDLQEPLRMVSIYTQKLAEHYKDQLDQDALDYTKFAVDGSKRMYDLINGLLAYSRIRTHGKKFAKVDMNDVLKQVTNNLNLKIKEKKAVLKIKKLPVIFADESQMVQLVQNLVVNAIKFSNESPVIHIGAKSGTDDFIFTVRDEGIGIESQYFERIFKIFQRLVRAEEYEGIGLGLAICQRIIERHSGNIWVKSEIGKGTTFYFSIPKNGEK